MSRLGPVKARKLQRALAKMGYTLARIQGSHHIYLHPQTLRRTTVPVHGGKGEVPPGTLKAILDDVGLSWEELQEFL
jgi:predicted RNA binding protein YcfA (HicA-like mRNA interferase family)